jgi:hypothetical protein
MSHAASDESAERLHDGRLVARRVTGEPFQSVNCAQSDLRSVRPLVAQLFHRATVTIGELTLLGDGYLIACRVERQCSEDQCSDRG